MATLQFRQNAEESQLPATIVENGRFDATEGSPRAVLAKSERKHLHHVCTLCLRVQRGVSMNRSECTTIVTVDDCCVSDWLICRHIASLQRRIEELQQRVDQSEAQSSNDSLSTEPLAHVARQTRRSAIGSAAGRSPARESMSTNTPRRRSYVRKTSRIEATTKSPTIQSQFSAPAHVDIGHSVNHMKIV